MTLAEVIENVTNGEIDEAWAKNIAAAVAAHLLSPESVERAIKAGRMAGDRHLTCSYPLCGCKGFPFDVRAAITALLGLPA